MNPGWKPSRIPVFLSALFFPGAGQFMQKRWVAGLFYMLTFTGAALIFIMTVMGPLIENMRIAIEVADGSNEPFVQTHLIKAMLYFALAMVIYAINVISAWRTYMAQMSDWRERKLVQQLQLASKTEAQP